MFFKLRSKWASVKNFFDTMLGERDPAAPEDKKKDTLKKPSLGTWLCVGFRIVGAVMVIASPGLLALPFLMGTPWIDTILLLAMCQWVGAQFMDFYRWWTAATSWMVAMWHLLRHGYKGMSEVMA